MGFCVLLAKTESCDATAAISANLLRTSVAAWEDVAASFRLVARTRPAAALFDAGMTLPALLARAEAVEALDATDRPRDLIRLVAWLDVAGTVRPNALCRAPFALADATIESGVTIGPWVGARRGRGCGGSRQCRCRKIPMAG
jgi:hypothetical protein